MPMSYAGSRVQKETTHQKKSTKETIPKKATAKKSGRKKLTKSSNYSVAISPPVTVPLVTVLPASQHELSTEETTNDDGVSDDANAIAVLNDHHNRLPSNELDKPEAGKNYKEDDEITKKIGYNHFMLGNVWEV